MTRFCDAPAPQSLPEPAGRAAGLRRVARTAQDLRRGHEGRACPAGRAPLDRSRAQCRRPPQRTAHPTSTVVDRGLECRPAGCSVRVHSAGGRWAHRVGPPRHRDRRSPRGHGPCPPGVRIHESRRFDPTLHLHPTRPPPRTRTARSAIDSAAWSHNSRTAVGVLAAVVQQRLTRVDDLRLELQAAGRIRHGRLLAAAVADIGGGSQALSEIDFARLCRRHGLPEPVRQAIRVESSGRRRYLDAEWVRADGVRVVAEVDGAVHLLPRQYWDDMERGNELALDGRIVLRFVAFALRAHEARVAAQLYRALVSLTGCPGRRSG